MPGCFLEAVGPVALTVISPGRKLAAVGDQLVPAAFMAA